MQICVWILYGPSLTHHHLLYNASFKHNNDLIVIQPEIKRYLKFNNSNCSFINKNNVTILPTFCSPKHGHNEYFQKEYQSLYQLITNLAMYNHTNYGHCYGFLGHLINQFMNISDHEYHPKSLMNSKPIQCLNQEYVYHGYRHKIDELSSISTQIDYETILFHISHKRALQLLLHDLFTVFYEYGIIIHLFGASALSWYRNCDPIIYHDHDIDLGIFQHHFNESIIKKIFDHDHRFKKYKFSVDFEHERTPLLNGKWRMQFHISSMKVYHKYSITCIDIFIINPTSFVYFAQNSWYNSQFFWWFTPYDLEKITVYQGDKELEFDAYIIANDYIELFLDECFGNDWDILPWMIEDEYIDESHLAGDNHRVVGMRPPIYTHTKPDALRLNVDKIIEFCVIGHGTTTTTEEPQLDYNYSAYDMWLMRYFDSEDA